MPAKVRVYPRVVLSVLHFGCQMWPLQVDEGLDNEYICYSSVECNKDTAVLAKLSMCTESEVIKHRVCPHHRARVACEQEASQRREQPRFFGDARWS